MSDTTENVLICGAAGDPCIVETAKPTSPDEILKVKNENPEIIAEVDASAATPSDKDGNSPNTDLLEGSGDSTNATPAISIPEVPISANGNDAQVPCLKENKQEEFEKKNYERDNYEKKLADTEKKMAALEAAYETATSGKTDETSLRRELKELKCSLAQCQAKLNDRGRLIANQESQINALTKQVSSLKEVVAITKNLLEIRNMEVKHLQSDVDSMENRITAERDRHNAMLRKMDAAVRLNADLKTEYETQLRLFQELRGKYEEKVTLLVGDNKPVCGAAVAEQPPSQTPSIQ